MKKQFLIMMIISLIATMGCQTLSQDKQSQKLEVIDKQDDMSDEKDDFNKLEENGKEQGKDSLQTDISEKDMYSVFDAEPTTKPTNAPTPTVKPLATPIPKPSYTYKEVDIVMYAMGSVNARTQPDKNGEKVDILKKGDKIAVTGRCNETGWYRIKLDGKAVYVSDKYLTTENPVIPTSTPIPTPISTAKPSPIPVPTVTPTPVLIATPKPTEEPVKMQEYTVKDMDDTTMYAKSSVNVRKGPSTKYDKIGALSWAQEVNVTGQASTGWYQIQYGNFMGYVSGNYLVEDKPAETNNSSIDMSFPIHYSDATCDITITKEWYQNAFVYAAHIKFSNYNRLGTTSANGKYNSGRETTLKAAKRIDALLMINGDYAIPDNGAGGYAVARDGIVCNDRDLWSEGIYNSNTGLFTYRTYDGCEGKMLSELVRTGKVTDTFQFGPAFLLNGSVKVSKGGGRAQTTFLGTNENPGDIWVCVADGRYNDGKSAGLTYYQCAAYLKSKGCTFGIPLDGGGSSTIVWNGKVLNAAKGNERAVADFLYFK